MKKLFLLLFSLLICVSLTACGNISEIINNFTDPNGNGGDPTTTASGGGAITTTKASGSDQKDDMNSKEEVINLIGDKYLICLKVTDSYSGSDGSSSNDTYYYTASDGTYYYWCVDDSNGSLYKKDGQYAIVYRYDEDTNKYTDLEYFPSELNPFGQMLLLFMLNEELEYTTKTAVTFLNRQCTKYEFKNTAIAAGQDASTNETWIIDNETGACMKHEVAYSSVSYGASASAAFEVTQFEINSQTVTTYMKAQTDKICVDKWDVDLFKEIGLSETGNYKIDLGDMFDASTLEKFQPRSASVSYYDDALDEYRVTFFVYLTKEQGETLANTLVQNIYGCGAKYNGDGEVGSINPTDESLYVVEEEDGTNVNFWFDGFTGSNCDYKVAIYVEWNAYINGGLWDVTVSAYKN